MRTLAPSQYALSSRQKGSAGPCPSWWLRHWLVRCATRPIVVLRYAMAGNPNTKKAMNTACSDTNRHSTQW
jgi:hypothetical protein